MRQGGSWEDGIWSLRYVPAVSASTFHFRDLDTMGRRKAWGSQYTFTARQTRSSAVSVRFLPEYSTASTWVEPSGSPLYSEGPGSRRRRASGSRRGPFGTRSYALYRKSGPGSFPESSSPARRSGYPGSTRYYFPPGNSQIRRPPAEAAFPGLKTAGGTHCRAAAFSDPGSFFSWWGPPRRSSRNNCDPFRPGCPHGCPRCASGRRKPCPGQEAV